MLFLSKSDDFSQNNVFENNLSKIISEFQTIWTLIRLDDMSGLIWVQTICQGYKQTALVGCE